jgi:hypothetical protein
MSVIKTTLTILLCAAGLHAFWVNASEITEDPFAKVDRMRRELNGTCSYPVIEKYRENRKLLCQLDSLRQRCNEIDDCYVYCIGQNVGEDIGGGCAHLCNYSLKKKWALPKSAKAC